MGHGDNEADVTSPEGLLFGYLVTRAEVQALLQLTVELNRRGDPPADGEDPLVTAFYALRRASLERLLRGLEDGCPGLSARMVEMYEGAREHLGDDRC